MFELPRQAPQIDHQLPSSLVAAIRRFLQALERDPLQLGWDVVVQPRDRRRLGVDCD